MAAVQSPDRRSLLFVPDEEFELRLWRGGGLAVTVPALVVRNGVSPEQKVTKMPSWASPMTPPSLHSYTSLKDIIPSPERARARSSSPLARSRRPTARVYYADICKVRDPLVKTAMYAYLQPSPSSSARVSPGRRSPFRRSSMCQFLSESVSLCLEFVEHLFRP